MFDLIELFTHWHAGRSQRQLAESLGIDRKTIAKYLAPAIAESVTPGGEPVTEAGWAAHIGAVVSGGRRSGAAGHDLAGRLRRTVNGSAAGCARRSGGDDGAAAA